MPALPSGRTPTGISRPVGTNSERIRFQSRAWPTGPEITSYSAAMIASMLATSASAAAGTLKFTGCAGGAAGAAGADCCANAGAAARAASSIRVARIGSLSWFGRFHRGGGGGAAGQLGFAMGNVTVGAEDDQGAGDGPRADDLAEQQPGQERHQRQLHEADRGQRGHF